MLRALRPSRRLLTTDESRVLAALAGVAFVVVVLFHPGEVYVDTRMDLYLDPGAFLRDTWSTWVSGSGLGAPNYNNGYLPVALVVWAGHALGVPVWLVVRLWRLVLVLVAAAGARRLLVDLTANRSPAGPVARVAAAVLYVANPYVVVGAATTPVLLPYALFPWLLLAVRRSLDPTRRLGGICGVGLVMFAMGGINAGVVPAFLMLAVLPVVIDARVRDRRTWRDLLLGLAGSVVAVLLVSLYWLVGTATALGTASAVADATETPRTVASVSSYAETLRGLGSWLLYGGDFLGPYRPGFVIYLENPLVAAATFTLAILAVLGALLTRDRSRALLTALTVLGLALMVGGYPPQQPSPLGRALFWAFDHVPLALAFRTTNKAGAIALLGMALLGALGLEVAWRRWSSRARGWLVGGVALGLALSLTPAWVGDLLPGRLDIPAYWTTAAHDLDSRGDDSGVWALPGESNALYRWRPLSVDDVASSLVHRNLVYSRSFPDGPDDTWNLMTGVQQGLGSGFATTRTLSAVAAYVGSSDVLMRNDMVWELMGAPRPAVMTAAAEGDPGLEPSALYGRAGENVAGIGTLVDPAEVRLPPLVRYHVSDPGSALRLYPFDHRLLIAGDGGVVPSAVWAGLLDGRRPFQELARAPAGDVGEALRAGATVLLTDTNRRREVNVHRLDRSGPLVSAAVEPDQTMAIGTPDDQTVATYEGVADVTASASGSIFGPAASGRPFLAVDGDRRTAWTVGDFGNGVGQWLQVDLNAPRNIDRVVVRRPALPGAAVSEIRVTVGGRSTTVPFGNGRRVVARFDPAVRADAVRVTVTRVSGAANNQVGLSEVSVPGVPAARESARLPRTVEDLAAGDPSLRALLEAAPTDVLLTRAVIEGEATMRRTFSLLASHDYRVRAEVSDPRRDWRSCRPLMTVDGAVLRARATEPVTHGTKGQVDVTGCGRVTLGTGPHTVTARKGVDRVLLDDGHDVRAARVVDLPARTSPTSFSGSVPATSSSSLLVVAQGYDPRWRATAGGRDLGAPLEVNGYAIGWVLPAGSARDVHVWFAPQTRFEVALGVSLVTVAGLAALGMVLAWRRRRRAHA